MPMYEYRCNKCDAVSEILTGVSMEEPSVNCAECGSTDLQKLISLSNFNVRQPVASGKTAAPCGAEPGETCGHCRYME